MQKEQLLLWKKVVKEIVVEATVEKVEDIMEIMKYNILSTPVVVIDEELIIKGRVPAKSELMDLFNK